MYGLHQGSDIKTLHPALTDSLGGNARQLKARHRFVPAHNSQFIWQQHTCGALGGSRMECGVVGQHYKTPYFHPDIGTHPPGMALPRTAWVWLNHLRTSVGRFCSCLYKWGMASSAACDFGAEERTVDHVVLQCPIHRSPHGLYGLTVLNDETIEWLLKTCPEIWCGLAGYELAQTMKKKV